MFRLRVPLVALLVTGALATAARVVADDAKPKSQCILNAFAAKLDLTADQKQDIQKAQAEFEQKSAPVCERMWKLHCDHHQAVLEILSPEQKKELPGVIKAERNKMLEHFATKLSLTEDQKKQAGTLCDEYAAKYQDLAGQDEGKRAGKFQTLKSEQFEAFCGILTDDQRVKLPALIQEELQAGRTPSSKSEIRNTMAEKLSLNEDQKQRLDKVCDEFAAKIDEQKTQIRALCKDKHAAMEKVLSDAQKVKFQEYVKSTGD